MSNFLKLHELQTQPMSEKLTHIFMTLYSRELNEVVLDESVITTVGEMSKKYFDLVASERIILQRLPEDMILSYHIVRLLGYLSETPGKAVLWAHWLNTHSKDEALSLYDLSSRYFPSGFPTDEEMHRAWDYQKVSEGPHKGKNKVDLQNIPEFQD